MVLGDFSVVDYAGILAGIYATYRAVNYIRVKVRADYEDDENGFSFRGDFNYEKDEDDVGDGD